MITLITITLASCIIQPNVRHFQRSLNNFSLHTVRIPITICDEDESCVCHPILFEHHQFLSIIVGIVR